jgi:hypothetical protein
MAGPQQDDPTLAAAAGNQFRIIPCEAAGLGEPAGGGVIPCGGEFGHREGEQAGDTHDNHVSGVGLTVEQPEGCAELACRQRRPTGRIVSERHEPEVAGAGQRVPVHDRRRQISIDGVITGR